jgi:hypothetical protein
MAEAINILKFPTWRALNIFSPPSVNIPFFISIKELPQIQARIRRRTQLFKFFDM